MKSLLYLVTRLHVVGGQAVYREFFICKCLGYKTLTSKKTITKAFKHFNSESYE